MTFGIACRQARNKGKMAEKEGGILPFSLISRIKNVMALKLQKEKWKLICLAQI